jgi:hypothetical protein
MHEGIEQHYELTLSFNHVSKVWTLAARPAQLEKYTL